jgi:hypothetical protein
MYIYMYIIYMIHDKKHQKGNLLRPWCQARIEQKLTMVPLSSRLNSPQKPWFSRGFPHWDHRMGVLNIRGMGLCT